MRKRFVLTIFLKELRETLRDRRTLLLVIGLPVLLYPLMLIGFSRLQESQSEASEARASVVAVWGSLPSGLEGALAGTAPVRLQPWLGLDDDGRAMLESATAAPPPLEKETEADRRQAARRRDRGGGSGSNQREVANPVLSAARALVTSRRVDAVIVAWPGLRDDIEGEREGRLSVYYDSVRADSRLARARVAEALDGYRTSLVEGRAARRRLPEGFAKGLAVLPRDVAPPARQTGYLLGTFLPFLLISLSVFGGFYPAVDLTAGEKERGTMQTLLCAPLKPLEIVSGKFLAVWTISLVTALVNLTSLATTVARIMPSGDVRLAPATIAMTVVMLVPITLTTTALFLAVAVFARDFKDGQNFLTPVYMALVVPAGVTMLPSIELNAWTAFVPVVNIALLVKALLVSEARGDLIFLTLVSSTAYAMLAILLAVRVFEREQILLGGRESLRTVLGLEQRRGGRPTPAVALVTFAVALVFAFYASLLLESRGILVTLVVTQLAFFLAPALAVTVGLGYSPADALSWRWPSLRALAASALLGMSAWAVVSGVVVRLAPPPDSLVRALERVLMLGDQPMPLWVVWLAIALLPALAEETFFRGLMLGGLKRLGKTTAIVGSAFAFAIAHASIYRLLPTLLLGIVIGYAVWKSGSILCGMVIHALNNGLLATLTQRPELAASLGIHGKSLSDGVTLAGVAVTAVGLWLLYRLPEPEAAVDRTHVATSS